LRRPSCQQNSEVIDKCRDETNSTNIDVVFNNGDPDLPESLSGITHQALYALIENARKYEGKLPGKIIIEEKNGEFCDGQFVDITYVSSSFTNDKTTDRLFVSPLPDQSNDSFRFGLFLTACQIRMIGGEASSIKEQRNPAGEYPFSIKLRLPLGISER